MPDRDYEVEARAQGWVPADEWRGDPEQHRDAETFVRRGEEILPFVNAKNRKLNEQVEELTGRVDQLLSSNAEFKQFTDKALERERTEKQQLVTQLESVRAQAVADGDAEKFSKADREIADLRAQPEPQRAPDISPDAQKWVSENSWYTEDSDLRALVDGLSDQIKQAKPWLSVDDHLNECKRRAQEIMPSKFENPNRDTQSVESPQGSKPNGKGRKFSDLPDEAREAFVLFKRDIPGITEEQYLSEYDWD